MKYVIFLLFLIFFSASVAGFEKCSCDTYRDFIRITNNQPFDMTYSVENSGTGSLLAKPNFDKVILKPGQSIDFINTYPGECSVYGKYYTITRITDSLGAVNKVERTFSIDQCEYLNAEISGNTNTCDNETIIDVSVQSEAKDAFTIGIEGYDNYDLSKERAIIEDELDFFVRFKGEGVIKPVIVLESVRTGQVLRIPLSIYFENCFDVDYYLEDLEDEICLGEHDLELVINNWGTREQNLSIDVDSGLSVEYDDEILIGPGEKRIIELEIDADEEGPNDMMIDIAGIEKTYKLDVLSDYDCTLLTLDKHYFKLGNVTGFNVEFENQGIVQTTYKIYEYSDIAEAGYEIELDAGQSAKIWIDLDDDLEQGEHYLGLYFLSDRGVEYKKDINFRTGMKVNYVMILVIIVIIIIAIILLNIRKK